MHGHHHRTEIIRLKQGVPSFDFFETLAATQQLETVSEVIQVRAVRRIDDADAFEIDVQRLRDFFNFGAVTKKNRRAEAKGIKLARCLQDTRFRAFRENNPFRMALQLFYDTADKSHAAFN